MSLEYSYDRADGWLTIHNLDSKTLSVLVPVYEVVCLFLILPGQTVTFQVFP